MPLKRAMTNLANLIRRRPNSQRAVLESESWILARAQRTRGKEIAEVQPRRGITLLVRARGISIEKKEGAVCAGIARISVISSKIERPRETARDRATEYRY